MHRNVRDAWSRRDGGHHIRHALSMRLMVAKTYDVSINNNRSIFNWK